ncbi:MAG: cyclopropane fatty acyl phospholipid synthase [Desulfobulbaceae bacterium]|jgi:cyclopropane-fatty-acyl-phospholipid synthase|nr:cyclopropane fatty acyl phospholipid synthase [Desulfobulbaceae bacterium]MDY0349691.1 cyclopropane fatty acyl phospholipid synthase [Desulfobulbaceae bacterium]
MSRDTFRQKAEELLALADVRVDGPRPWDIRVHNDDFYPEVLCRASLGLGESYMDGWWDCPELDQFFFRILRAGLDSSVKKGTEYFCLLRSVLFNLQKPSRAFQIGRRHYDIGNGLYAAMLDRRLIYSCACWDNASTLDEAQEAKLDLIFRKLNLEPGMKVLDIGCGWGGAAKFAAQRYGVEVVGITVSREQAAYAEKSCRGLPVEIVMRDYRDVEGRFDRVFSIGMFEHVGFKNYRTYMQKVRKCLKDDGLFLLHTIGSNRSSYTIDPWIERYIFPNSMLPSAKQICAAAENLFVVEDFHNIGSNYDATLMHWFRNFDANWDTLKTSYDERFYRMWKYYLLSCAGSFRARRNQVWQIVLSPKGIPGGYKLPRYSREAELTGKISVSVPGG